MAETASGTTSDARTARPQGLSTGNWIAIATVVLGGVIGFGLSEHNARLTNVGTSQTALVAAHVGLAVEIKTVSERLNGMEQRVDERLNGMEQRLDERLNGMEQRLDERVDELDERLSRIEANIDRLLERRVGNSTEPPNAAAPD